jgi:hypothetical protein
MKILLPKFASFVSASTPPFNGDDCVRATRELIAHNKTITERRRDAHTVTNHTSLPNHTQLLIKWVKKPHSS